MAGRSKRAFDVVLGTQQDLWKHGQRTPIESLASQFELSDDETLDLIYAEVLLREELGERPECDEYCERFPQFADQIKRQFQLHDGLRQRPE